MRFAYAFVNQPRWADWFSSNRDRRTHRASRPFPVSEGASVHSQGFRRQAFRRLGLTGLLLALVGTALAGTTTTASATAGRTLAPGSRASAAGLSTSPIDPAGPATEHAACPKAAPGHVRCLSYWRGTGTRGGSLLAAVAGPARGIRPIDIRRAYKLPKTGGRNQTIAIVDAFDNPKAESDLKVYRSVFRLPACTTANRCFRKVNQRGGTTYPRADAGWGEEISLDIQAVSAACHACKILLVEADNSGFEAMGAAVNTAVRLGATVVSNSYGGAEFNGLVALGKKYYVHKGVPMVAASGDAGFPDPEFPADLSNVWSVGGTFLAPAAKGAWHESAASFGSSACSGWVAKPSYQKDTHCGM